MVNVNNVLHLFTDTDIVLAFSNFKIPAFQRLVFNAVGCRIKELQFF